MVQWPNASPIHGNCLGIGIRRAFYQPNQQQRPCADRSVNQEVSACESDVSSNRGEHQSGHPGGSGSVGTAWCRLQYPSTASHQVSSLLCLRARQNAVAPRAYPVRLPSALASSTVLCFHFLHQCERSERRCECSRRSQHHNCGCI